MERVPSQIAELARLGKGEGGRVQEIALVASLQKRIYTRNDAGPPVVSEGSAERIVNHGDRLDHAAVDDWRRHVLSRADHLIDDIWPRDRDVDGQSGPAIVNSADL